MARKTAKKQAEAPKVDIGAEIFASLRELEKLKGIPVDYMVERLKQALTNAYRKDREDRRDVPADNVVVDLSEHGLSMHIVKTAVEEVEDTALEIPIDAARNYNPDVQVGDPVNIPVDIQKFGRIAAQTAKQVVIQGIREAERGVAYESYSNKAQELMTGTVLRIDPTTGDMFLRIGQGNDTSDAVLQAGEQIPGETHHEGDMIRVYVLEVHKMGRGPLIHVSRTHPNLVRRLFELETPEIADGQVEIRNIAREAGSRSKMAVRAAMEGIDPVGACVGPHGGRVGAVVKELGEEPVGAIARAGKAYLILVAADASDHTWRRAKSFAAGTDQQCVRLKSTKEEMGFAIGRTSLAIAAVTDVRLALTLLTALGESEKNREALEVLSAKAEKVKKHQAEAKAHVKNVRKGKKKQ